jgi:Xaa-Pro dipeptidase
MNEIRKRLKKINYLKDRMDGVLLFSSDPNFFYFTKSTSGILFYDFSKPVIMQSRIDEKPKGFRRIVIKNKEFIEKLPKGVIGIDEKKLPVSIFRLIRKRARTRNITKELENIRSIKTSYEVKCIQKACKISKDIFFEIDSKDLSEIRLKQKLLSSIHDHGVEPSFDPIVASRSNTRNPHHVPTKKKIKKPLLIDFGVKYKGYCSDVTRTIGHSKERQLKELLEAVYPRIKPGVKAADIDLFVRKKLGRDKKFFLHSLGHGIGIEIHEKPSLSKDSKDILKENMVFTIEPGIYKRDGIRIENDFLLKKNSLKNLTDF